MLTERQKANVFNLWLMNPEMTPKETRSHFRFLDIDNSVSDDTIEEVYQEFTNLSSKSEDIPKETPIGSNPYMEFSDDFV